MVNRILLSFFAAALASSTPTTAQDVFFLQMSDPQFGMYTNNAGFAQETANFQFAIATANRLHPAFVVVSGDLVNKTGDGAQIAEYLRVLHQLDPAIPVYNVPGNHDVGNVPTAETLAAYRRAFGRDYYTFHSGTVEGIVLDSSIIQHPDNVPDEESRQREWLKDELKKAAASRIKTILVFQHIPWFLHSPDEPDQYFNIPLDRRREYLQLLEQSGVKYDFAGHYHQNAEGTDGAFTMITSGPVGKPLGQASSGMRIISVGENGICHRYFGLGNLPNQVEQKALSTQP